MESAQIGLDKLFELHIYKVSELTRRIRDELEAEFDDIWVEGEISNLRIPASGHIYLTLKDESSQIRAIIFKSQRDFIPFTPQDGLSVLAKGRVSVYEPRGEYQMLIDYMEPKGKGALQLAFEQLKERLAKEGLFDEKRKKPLPLLPQKIGVVTSSTGAAIRDILRVIDRRFANVHVVINPVRVQGEGAAAEIARAVDELNAMGGLDVIIVGRGGGSLEDLWAFNEEAVARAIFRSKIPVISAVGHEVDFTIADFVADLRAPTPSVAAEMVVKSKADLAQHLANLKMRLASSTRHKVTASRAVFAQCAGSRAFAMPKARVYSIHQRVDELSLRLGKAVAAAFKGSKTKLGALLGKLDSLNPLAVLSRGYSVCRRPPGMEIVKSFEQVAPGDDLSVKLWRGELICGVKEVLPDR